MNESAPKYRVVETPWGEMAFVADGRKLVGVLLPARSQRQLLRGLSRRWPQAKAAPRLLPQLARQLRNYFAGRTAVFSVACDLSGYTEFQRRVLDACRRVPAGSTVSYGRLAARVGRPAAARAVGGVMAANPMPLVIPCHRVVSATGGLGGFSALGGTAIKRRLLDHEARLFGPRGDGREGH
jgi:methylated-DNA-[protein]-cysteine S-methyltransferase